MRIPCPHCGERPQAEFTYRGDAKPRRPQEARRLGPEGGFAAPVLADFVDYVYLRDNPAGLIREWWQHTGGCRAWIAVDRDVTTHVISAVVAARELAR